MNTIKSNYVPCDIWLGSCKKKKITLSCMFNTLTTSRRYAEKAKKKKKPATKYLTACKRNKILLLLEGSI